MLAQNWKTKHGAGPRGRIRTEDHLHRQVTVLFGMLSDLYGSDKVVLRAVKLDALALLRSEHLAERVLALQRLVFEDPTFDTLPPLDAVPEILEEVEDEVANLLARRTVEDQLEKKVGERMQKRHEEYVREIRDMVLRESSGPENAQTLKRLALLEKADARRLTRSALEVLRPTSFDELLGQKDALTALLAKLSSPFPQHVILYGPPGVGKTTAARLALEAAKKIPGTAFGADAPFVEVNGATLRWDPREVTNPLLGSVHDPIYQGARRDLAETGVPEPKPGLVTEAHGGVLFIDEIGEMDILLQNKLLKVMEDKRVFFDSAYFDPHDASVPRYIKKLFEEGAPADFILIGATTRDPEDISPAVRSRTAEVYFGPLTPNVVEEIVRQAAARLEVEIDEAVPALVAEYTVEGRKAISILADTYGHAFYRAGRAGRLRLGVDDVRAVIQAGRLSPHTVRKASPRKEVGRLFGLAVQGFHGTVLEIEAVAFPARTPGQGRMRFNETAGSMARDSVFNAASVIRRLTGEDLADYDVHVNVVGGGRIDGPSAGTAILMAVWSALKNIPFPQDVAVTGELSIQGKIRAVGGIPEKLYGARQAGIRRVIIPAENTSDLPPVTGSLEIVPVSCVEDIVRMFMDA